MRTVMDSEFILRTIWVCEESAQARIKNDVRPHHPIPPDRQGIANPLPNSSLVG